MASRRLPLRIDRRRDFGQIVARLFCAVFAVIGALPLLLVLIVRATPVREWAAQETAALLQRELGIVTRFDVVVRAWPLSVEVRDLRLDGSDGSGPALELTRLSVRPRLFSLLAGKIDAGDVEIDGPRIRLVVRDGQIENLDLDIPESDDRPLDKAPFETIAITDARLDLDIDGYVVRGEEIDFDIQALDGFAFELALRSGRQEIVHERELLSDAAEQRGERAVDDDLLCHLDARIRIDPSSILVRRLDLLAAVDLDPRPDTLVGCTLDKDDPRRLELRLGQVRVKLPSEEAPFEVEGRIAARAPVALTNRYVPFLPVQGWVGVDVEGRYDGRHVLPELKGRLEGGGLELERYKLAKTLSGTIQLASDKVFADALELTMADGRLRLSKIEVDPFANGGRLRVGALDIDDVRFPGLMRDLGVTPQTIVAWTLGQVRATNIEGRFDPLRIDGDVRGETSDFAVFDRAFDDPRRERMIGVDKAKIQGRFNVRSDALVLSGMQVDFGKSHVETTVSIGFDNDFGLEVGPASRIDLGDVSPIGNLEMAGRASLSASMEGKGDDVLLQGDVSVAGLELAGFPFGDVTSAKVRFYPLVVEFADVQGKKNKTSFYASQARLDFGGASAILAEANVEAPSFDLRDFFHMWHFDEDPRFDDLAGSGRASARIRYDLGGPADRCKGGFLDVRGEIQLTSADLFDERYDEAAAEFHYVWLDPEASDLGLHVDIPSLTLRKGRGRIFGSATIRPGGELRANVAADEIPLSRIQGLGPLGMLLDGAASATARISGTTDELEADVAVRLSPVQVGMTSLPESKLHVALRPERREKKPIGRTHCGRPIFPPFDKAAYERDEVAGVFEAKGSLFGGQIALEDLRITRQRKKVARGAIVMNRLDLGAFASLVRDPREEALRGTFSGRLDLEKLSFDALDEARAALTISELKVGQEAAELSLRSGTPPITIADNRLALPEIALDLSATSGLRASLITRGEIRRLSDAPQLDIDVRIPPTDLSALSGLLPRVERANGKLEAKVKLTGAPDAPLMTGGAKLENGELSLRGLPVLLSEMNADVSISGGEVRLVRATANVGGGTLAITGNAPLHGFELGDATASILASGIHLPVTQGVSLSFDAELFAQLAKAREGGERSLPRISGDVTLTSFSYTRPISIVEDLGSMAQRSRRKLFDAYDPLEDVVGFDIHLRAREPLRLRNNLVDALLVLDSESLELAGTNQSFGMRGQLRVLPSGRVRLRANEFEVRQGWVRFDDPTRISPSVDILAVTEYRRSSSSADPSSSATPTGGEASASAVGNAGGSYRITLHAYGDADDLRLDMTSDPALSQEDIALLLYIGMTRAELDQLQASSIGETAALEALSALSGADTVVKQAVPVIDDFRLGSAYSSRTGRTEPTITVGKRVTEQVRASVTSGLSDNREVRSNLEWRLTPKLSLQGSYDNVNDMSQSSLPNVGVDVRYRLELE